MRLGIVTAIVGALVFGACHAYDRALYDDLVRDGASAVDAVVTIDSDVADSQSPDDHVLEDVAPATTCDGGTPCNDRCVDTQSDPTNCGGCGIGCPGVIGGMPGCEAGVCTAVCTAGRHLCLSTCVDSTSIDTCGAACSPCTPRANATSACDGSGCRYVCAAAFGDCNGDLSDPAGDGCETPLNTAAHCGACATACNSTAPLCSGSTSGNQCTTGCATGQSLCGTSCIDVTSDPMHCGSCTACPAHAHSTAACSASRCTYTCVTGFADCNGNPGDGCEVDVRTSPTNCGACSNACPPVGGGTQTCVAGTCTPVCAAGFVSVQGRCSNFGGGFVDTTLNCPSTCVTPNPLTGGCSCPAGFATITYGAQTYCDTDVGPASFNLCEPPTPSATSSFAGAYLQISAASTCAPRDCQIPNPHTGACSCPSGTTPITMLTRKTPGGCPTVEGNLVFCTRTPASADWFRGAYQRFTEATVVPQCAASNPFTGGCSCPTGTREIQMAVRAASPTSPASIRPTVVVLCVPQ